MLKGGGTMQRLLSVAAMAAGLLLCGGWAQAQPGQRGTYTPDAVSGLIDRVHADLNQSYADGWKFTGGDRNRLNDAEKELREFSKKWDKGHFDKGELNDAISRIQRVVDQNHMPPVDRNQLDEDLGQLRRMREAFDRHEIW
jgi:predicted Zn-dependent protease